MELADRVVVMNAGRIEQIGPPGDLYLEPQTLQVAEFIGSMNRFDSQVVNGRADWHGHAIAIAIAIAQADGPITLLCRPEDLRAAPDGAFATTSRVIDLGAFLKVSLITDAGEQLTWLCPRAEAPAVGTRLALTPAHLHLFRGILRIGTALPGTQSLRMPKVTAWR